MKRVRNLHAPAAKRKIAMQIAPMRRFAETFDDRRFPPFGTSGFSTQV